MKQQKTIVEVVEKNKKTQKLIQELLEKKFLYPGIYDDQAYLIDEDAINSALKKDKKNYHAVMVHGISLHYGLVYYTIVDYKNRSKETKDNVKYFQKEIPKWRNKVLKYFPGDFKKMDKTCSEIGVYIEHKSRKSQGF